MNLYSLKSSDFKALFGDPPKSVPDAVIIGQNSDCTEFLLLSGTAYPELSPCPTTPEGFIFTYRQAWGIHIDDTVIDRVKKDIRDNGVSDITVTTSTGKVFDGDETSQNRICRMITIMEAKNIPTAKWKLHGSKTETDVTKDEFVEALFLAGTKQTQLWFA